MSVERQQQIEAEVWTQTIRNALDGYWATEDDFLEARDDAHKALDALAARLSGLQDTAAEVVRQYHLWSEDANDGEFAIWRSEDFINAIIALRTALSATKGAKRA